MDIITIILTRARTPIIGICPVLPRQREQAKVARHLLPLAQRLVSLLVVLFVIHTLVPCKCIMSHIHMLMHAIIIPT